MRKLRPFCRWRFSIKPKSGENVFTTLLRSTKNIGAYNIYREETKANKQASFYLLKILPTNNVL